ncbi:3-phosphoshikimate 1-carboxyvinyltransferase [Pyxidicoccus parkwayensis]|uniref:3-phosphoshikimate 1-carboxyvinyltransferase n=1 Tax=Pyxidicoccus parkwayensis TaxID=2813578 RepID=A0ABX7P7U1_9BACT|nr:3-phosphoshikimate 1-carboxyvinyltransferase [Pyxidicoccus parkwaysis]QSQ26516.1 3-phosphoshikimate 1-carboxyvinyltransferase [Pyxidicoccus parkwaysis]
MSSTSVSRILVNPAGLKAAPLTPPVSKSDAQRALVLGHLTGAWPLPSVQAEPDEDLPADVRVLRRGVEALRQPPGVVRDVDCADGGAPFRILVTQAAVTPGAHVRFTGTPRLGERPHGPLFTSLREALGGAGLTLTEGTPWPVELRAPRDTTAVAPVFRVPGAQSSQYASSLLLGCAALYLRERRAWSVEIEGHLTSAGYLDLTVTWLKRFGFVLQESPSRYTVSGYAAPPSVPSLPGDWSSLGYLLLVSWKAGGTVERADTGSAHPDDAIVRLIEQVGLKAVPAGAPHTLKVEGRLSGGLRASGKECPDLLPTLAALACVLPAPSTLTDVSILRVKESDRLEGIRSLVAAYGGTTDLQGESLEIRPPAAPPARFEMNSRGDHRLAMTAATLCVLSGTPLLLTGPECVEKSFPGFWRQLARMGVLISGAQ